MENPSLSSAESNRNDQKVKLLAFYLPQFHPIPENDSWWGKGFTEWTNVRNARPLFPGHYQPQIPGELGYYDLRDLHAREAQANLARAYGIHGFCYYHYWFHGRRLLERPFQEVFQSGKPDFPFCLAWANESWSKAWSNSRRILIKQTYSEADDIRHIRWLCEIFKDQRYIRVKDRPLLLVYNALQHPNPRRLAETWRREAKRMGIGDIHLCKIEGKLEDRYDPEKIGFDAAVEFQGAGLNQWAPTGMKNIFLEKIKLYSYLLLTYPHKRGNLYLDYSKQMEAILSAKDSTYLKYPCIYPGWDNSPRRKRGAIIVKGAKPQIYEDWLKSIVKKVQRGNFPEKLIFVNAWNEWGEGAYLEPDQKFGRAYLEATMRALSA